MMEMPVPTAPEQVAWIVGQNEEGCEVIFAETAGEAWAETSPCEGCVPGSGCECYPGRVVEREPRFDRHAPGPVPVSALEAAGWAMPCEFCADEEANMPGDWTTVIHEGREVPACWECRQVLACHKPY
jgi:hypothetical protein